MKTFRVRIKFLSPCRTPLQSDTLFGCLCWMIRYTKGDESLPDEILKNYDEFPVLLVSDGFPAGWLPFPLMPPLSDEGEKQLFSEFFQEKNGEDFFKFKALLKRFRKTAWVDIEDLEEYKEDLTALNLARSFISGVVTKNGKIIPKKENDDYQKIRQTLVSHNTINRLTGAVEKEGGGFFHTAETNMQNSSFDIYLKTSLPWNEDFIRRLFEQLGRWGYGGDRSIGRGQFIVEEVGDFALPETGNAVMSLSRFVPDDDLEEGYYDLDTKYGKLGGIYSQGSVAFPKTPMVMLTPGSIFKVKEIKPFYGVSLGAVHTDPELKGVRQQTYLFPYFINLGEE